VPYLDEKKVHDLAIIWTQTKWQDYLKTISSNEKIDEGHLMKELFSIYKDAFDYFSNFGE